MPYPITIGCTPIGAAVIGAKRCKERNATIIHRVYGCQLRHRVTARMPDGTLAITTPTGARKLGWTVIDSFATGSANSRITP